jgi:hypothetical protein
LDDTSSTEVIKTKLTETKESSKMQKEVITVIVCITLAVCSSIAAFTIYNINDRNNMARNIESAIQKGIDPISVKCAYETNTNAVCIAYSMGKK